jgi:mRNA-degrading endonuclease YafQ of YafQ-DinJ toxin-antitoxin module
MYQVEHTNEFLRNFKKIKQKDKRTSELITQAIIELSEDHSTKTYEHIKHI